MCASPSVKNGGLPTAQTNAIEENNVAQYTPVINARHAMAF
jgi:hypothetical protein